MINNPNNSPLPVRIENGQSRTQMDMEKSKERNERMRKNAENIQKKRSSTYFATAENLLKEILKELEKNK